MAFKKVADNDYGLFNCREGMYDGHTHVFTHYNPKTNEVYSDTIPNGDEYGKWVHKDEVTFTS